MTLPVFTVPMTSESVGWQLRDMKWCFAVHLFDIQMIGVTHLSNFLRPPSQRALPTRSGRVCSDLLFLSLAQRVPHIAQSSSSTNLLFWALILPLFFHELLQVFKNWWVEDLYICVHFFCIYLPDHFFLKSKRTGISHAEVEFTALIVAIWAARTFRIWVCRQMG